MAVASFTVMFFAGKPASVSTLRACASLIPTSPAGILLVAGPSFSFSVTVLPFSACLPAGGSWSVTCPSVSEGPLTCSTFATKPACSTSLVASFSFWLITAGTCARWLVSGRLSTW